MKKIHFAKIFFVFSVSFCCFSLGSKAQMVYIQDTAFKAELISKGYGSCITGDSIDPFCSKVDTTTILDVSYNPSLHNLQGIQAFHNLVWLDCSNDSISNIPSLPGSLTFLACWNNQLTSLPVLPTTLKVLVSNNNQLTSLPALPASLNGLFCTDNQITSLPALPASLANLWCANNQLTNLPSLPSSLTFLECSDNQLTSLPVLPTIFNYLVCNNNQLTSLPALPASLNGLFCTNNQITSLPALPASLTELSCTSNQLTVLPALPASLVELLCDTNQLTSLPVLPATLDYLACNFNQLMNLPVLPTTLVNLYCENNQLTSLPALPSSLTYFYCWINQLTSLPALPSSLVDLDCSNNQLTSIPVLPGSLIFLACWNNQLTSLPALPDYMNTLWCDHNPNLSCLPELHTIDDLDFSATSITCLPNYGNVTNSYPPLNSIPLCDVLNPAGCQAFWNIRGRSYNDSNQNCVFDSADVSGRNMHILLFQNGNLLQQVCTGDSGFYAFGLDGIYGIYQVSMDTSNSMFNLLCPPGNQYSDTITVQSPLISGNDFSLVCGPGFDVGVQSIYGRFSPGLQSRITTGAGDLSNFYGGHCAGGVGGTVTISFTGSVSYVGPDTLALTPVVSGDTLTYVIADFGTLDFLHAFNFILHTDTNALPGSSVCITVVVSSASVDNNPSNDTLIQCFAVRSAFDPNEKEVSPADNIDPNGNHWLTYTVQFQNTGNASAGNIYILDTLDSNLDPATFRLLLYNHQPIVNILDNIMKFDFPDINLPDSNSNEPLSHGFVQYQIKLKNGLPLGTEVENTAYIYFDFNTPVATNTTRNTLQLPVYISSTVKTDFPVTVYPNPSKNEFTVYCLRFTAADKVILKLYDAVGQLVLSEKMLSSHFTLQTSGLSSGIYFLKIESQNGVVMKKVVKE